MTGAGVCDVHGNMQHVCMERADVNGVQLSAVETIQRGIHWNIKLDARRAWRAEILLSCCQGHGMVATEVVTEKGGSNEIYMLYISVISRHLTLHSIFCVLHLLDELSWS